MVCPTHNCGYAAVGWEQTDTGILRAFNRTAKSQAGSLLYLIIILISSFP